MSAPSLEQTISQVIGKVIVIPAYQRLEASLRDSITALDEEYYLLTQEEYVKGPLAKYGILDVTFQHSKSKQFLKIYCEADGIGYFSQLKKSGKKFDMDEMYKYVLGHLKDIESLFPVRANVIDCCFTNDQGIWDEKYFYS